MEDWVEPLICRMVPQRLLLSSLWKGERKWTYKLKELRWHYIKPYYSYHNYIYTFNNCCRRLIILRFNFSFRGVGSTQVSPLFCVSSKIGQLSNSSFMKACKVSMELYLHCNLTIGTRDITRINGVSDNPFWSLDWIQSKSLYFFFAKRPLES